MGGQTPDACGRESSESTSLSDAFSDRPFTHAQTHARATRKCTCTHIHTHTHTHTHTSRALTHTDALSLSLSPLPRFTPFSLPRCTLIRQAQAMQRLPLPPDPLFFLISATPGAVLLPRDPTPSAPTTRQVGLSRQCEDGALHFPVLLERLKKAHPRTDPSEKRNSRRPLRCRRLRHHAPARRHVHPRVPTPLVQQRAR